MHNAFISVFDITSSLVVGLGVISWC